ncbi:MAG: carotenoid 1,2-hydratase [Burkholderiales bacterium]|nr:carotenoid 1,2-hydratase [Burkholderiales bacterium]
MPPPFDAEVPAGGYAWWYVDALADDGRHGISLIAFVGSVFSPYYAWRRGRSGAADPLDHCALNVALYGERGRRWAMTERGRARVRRAPASLAIGPSALSWDGDALAIAIDEITAPLPGRIRGRVRVRPAALGSRSFALDAAGRHRWTPVAPCARVEVALESPRLAWSGPGYFDANTGDEPLEAAFRRWDWSRAALAGGDAAVLYDVERRDGTRLSLALRFDRGGGARPFAPPPRVGLPRTLWRVARGTRADDGRTARVARTLEDAPFYSRSVVRAQLLGEGVTAMHESLSLDRFRSGWVRALLPFRMPRVAR